MSKTLLKIFEEKYRCLKNDLLNCSTVTGLDSGYENLTAEIISSVLKKSVLLTRSVEILDSQLLRVVVGEVFNLNKLTDLGYVRVERVWSPGEYAVLGDIVIVWSYGSDMLLRVSLSGDRVDAIDLLDKDSRKRMGKREAADLFAEGLEMVVGGELHSESHVVRIVPTFSGEDSVDMGVRSLPLLEQFGSESAVLEIVKNYKSRGYVVLLVTRNIDRYDNLEKNVFEKYIDNIIQEKETFVKKGFVSSVAKIVVLTDLEVFGEVDLSLYSERNIVLEPGSVEILKKILPGDYVVHEDHGIGKYIDMTKRDSGYYMEIAYAGKDKLYVPLSASDKLTKFIGAGKSKPVLTGLNSGVWKRISSKAKERAESIAKDLLALYALREITKVEPVLNDSNIEDLLVFVKSFQFEDTDDQLLATEQIVQDLKCRHPMDRLLVGDVGYGKTEIAMRTAFAVVNEGYQVAVLAPTTILVEQHLATFKERFRNYPFVVKSLSRGIAEEEKIFLLNDLKEGKVDIIIGTHSLLSDSVEFKKLGLIIVDEEQKFGVKQKEKLKSSRINCNVLSLTATPIPRTLNMALMGIRDISVLGTPPEGRLSVKNEIKEFSWESVSNAVRFELDRGGQVYFLHNRVSNIVSVARRLEELFPSANIAVAHGQMNVQSLYKIMSSFIRGDVDILVCTTIIENGLDIPNVNTLIIDDASNLGLSQMYQIRGRIGREKKQAYAYFFFDSLKGNSSLRLSAIKDSEDLGSGFLLSNKDLEIRGAGDILGSNQSGVINSVGYGLYAQMLNDAVARLNGVGK